LRASAVGGAPYRRRRIVSRRDAAAGGFPAMTGNIPFLMKDVVLLAASIYLLSQDVRRELLSTRAIEAAQIYAPEKIP
jgi:hypothetical protein